ncbi:MAG: polyhydroxyalkanoic acid system family protein [Gammaproteobacteria bacterium]|nr:polyhydroxyalkanoic acid system family protein [Gammaproteobacteria bacterium]
MSHINIRRKHNLSLDKARKVAETVAVDLDKRFSLNYYWEDDTLFFERSGVNGRMTIEAQEIRVDVRLGFLLLPLKPSFEQAIHRYMDELIKNS